MTSQYSFENLCFIKPYFESQIRQSRWPILVPSSRLTQVKREKITDTEKGINGILLQKIQPF